MNPSCRQHSSAYSVSNVIYQILIKQNVNKHLNVDVRGSLIRPDARLTFLELNNEFLINFD